MGLRKPIEHGTRHGYKAHRRVPEAPCVACKAANAAWQQNYRRRKSTPWKLLEMPSGADPVLPTGYVPWGPAIFIEATADERGWLVPPTAVVKDGLWSPLPRIVRVSQDLATPSLFVGVEPVTTVDRLGLYAPKGVDRSQASSLLSWLTSDEMTIITVRSERVKIGRSDFQNWWFAHRGSELIAKRGSKPAVVDAAHQLINRLRQPYEWASEFFPPLIFIDAEQVKASGKPVTGTG